MIVSTWILATLEVALASGATAFRAQPVHSPHEQGHKTLHPTHPPNHDSHDLRHLRPNERQELFFAEKGRRGKTSFDRVRSDAHADSNPAGDVTAFGHMNSVFQHPTVVLDHSHHVSTIRCSTHGLSVCFANAKAHNEANRYWLARDDSPLLFSTHSVGCGKFTDGERSFWKATDVSHSSNGLCLDITASEVQKEDAVDNFELEFGHDRSQSPHDHIDNLRRRASGAGMIASTGTTDITDDPQALSEFFGININTDYPETGLDAPVDYNGTLNDVTRRYILERRGFFDFIGDIINVS
jgi:hypothetical protein